MGKPPRQKTQDLAPQYDRQDVQKLIIPYNLMQQPTPNKLSLAVKFPHENLKSAQSSLA